MIEVSGVKAKIWNTLKRGRSMSAAEIRSYSDNRVFSQDVINDEIEKLVCLGVLGYSKTARGTKKYSRLGGCSVRTAKEARETSKEGSYPFLIKKVSEDVSSALELLSVIKETSERDEQLAAAYKRIEYLEGVLLSSGIELSGGYQSFQQK